MTKEKLRSEYERLTWLQTLNDSVELMDICMNYLFKIIENHHHEAETEADLEAEIVNQMVFTKTAHLKQLVGGINFESESGTTLNRIIDPTIVASHVRNLYETVAMFNLIYVNTDSPDEKTILYNLWVSAGLKFRQRFEVIIKSEEQEKKLLEEQETIEKLKNEIENTDLYKSLAEKEQNKIQTKLKEKDYKIQFKGDKVIFLSWQDVIEVIGVEGGYMDSIYTYFSLYSHPSNVSVFQFAEMFGKEDSSFLELTNFNLKNYFFFLSIFIADYIKVFPNVLETYNGIPQIDQIVINRLNAMIRSDAHSINNAFEALS